MNRISCLRTFIVRALAVLAGTLGLVASSLAAEPFPSRPIKLVVPYPPGGANDVLGRAVAQKISESLKTPVVLENRAGAGGVIGTSYVAKSPADGYTLLIINTVPHTATASLYAKAPYDPVADFTPISLIASTPYVIVVGAQSKFHAAADLIGEARRTPGSINYASGGQGGATNLVMELFKLASGADLTHVPYKGGGPALTDVMGGQVQVTFENIVAVLPLVKGGSLRPLAVSTAQPSMVLPGVPTVASVVKSDFDVQGRFALVAPAGLPPDVLAKLNAATVAAVKSPDVVHTFEQQGIVIESSTPDRLREILKSETAVWSRVIREKGIRLE